MVKVGIRNFLLVGIMAVMFIVLGKVVTAKYPVAGVSDIMQSV